MNFTFERRCYPEAGPDTTLLVGPCGSNLPIFSTSADLPFARIMYRLFDSATHSLKYCPNNDLAARFSRARSQLPDLAVRSYILYSINCCSREHIFMMSSSVSLCFYWKLAKNLLLELDDMPDVLKLFAVL